MTPPHFQALFPFKLIQKWELKRKANLMQALSMKIKSILGLPPR